MKQQRGRETRNRSEGRSQWNKLDTWWSNRLLLPPLPSAGQTGQTSPLLMKSSESMKTSVWDWRHFPLYLYLNLHKTLSRKRNWWFWVRTAPADAVAWQQACSLQINMKTLQNQTLPLFVSLCTNKEKSKSSDDNQFINCWSNVEQNDPTSLK